MHSIKTKEEIKTKLQTYIENNSTVNYFGEGSVIGTIVDAIAQELYDFYLSLDYNYNMSKVSTAEGIYLDKIGELLNVTRLNNESDNNYRIAINDSVYSLATANEKAIISSCRRVPNVRDIKVIQYAMGTGSFAVYIDFIDSTKKEGTINEVQKVLNENKAFGNIGVVVSPKEIKIDLTCKVTYKGNVSIEEKNNILAQIKQIVYNYIDNLEIGQQFFAKELELSIMSTSSKIGAFEVSLFNIDGKRSYFKDVACQWNEQFSPGLIEII